MHSTRWIEAPTHSKPMRRVAEQKRIHFEKVASFREGAKGFEKVRRELRDGDVIAYFMSSEEAKNDVLQGNVNSVGYKVLDYGHLAILTSQPNPKKLHLFSSQSFKGPNTQEDVDTLRDHSFDVYRLNRWDQVNKAKFHEFVSESQKKAGNKLGYDFSGMFGLWNSELKPKTPKQIGHDYICSTIVAAGLYYAGADLKASNRLGIFDLVSPRQVVMSHGELRDLDE